MASPATTDRSNLKPWHRHHLSLDQYQYLKIKIWAEKALDVKVTELAFRMSLQQAIGTSLGIAGTGFKMDVLDWNDDTHIGIVKVPQSALIMVWGTFATHHFSMAGQTCALDILDNSASLISLADHSRDQPF